MVSLVLTFFALLRLFGISFFFQRFVFLLGLVVFILFHVVLGMAALCF